MSEFNGHINRGRGEVADIILGGVQIHDAGDFVPVLGG